tara:strand:+ start:597 stop:1496 length:900 start_codon:yes stop_codon:yes gene_type:complete
MNNLDINNENKKYILDVNESDFAEKIIKGSNEKTIIVDFWAPWCGPCKQLTPVLEKIAINAKGKILLAKINIDENQQIAAQLRIQSIPMVFAFKNERIADGFQGVIPEKQIVEFIEKILGEKLHTDHSGFYEQINIFIKENKFEEAVEQLENFLSENSNDVVAIKLYIDSLVGLKKFIDANDFLSSISSELLNTNELKSAISNLKIKEKNSEGPDLSDIEERYKNKPDDLNILIELSEKYFSNDMIEKSFDILLENYIKSNDKNKDKIKNIIVKYFDALGNDNENTKIYRKKFSSIMFA